jgi:poly-gamma-glutamate synthesis protein (capsule biosynthesis protein)
VSTHRIGLLGDIFLSRAAGTEPFIEVGLDDAELWFANLEAPLADIDRRLYRERTWESGSGFASAPALVADLRGLTAVSIANNHALDFGVDAYERTIGELDEAGIGHAGGGHDEVAARAPFICDAGGLTVAFLAYTCVYLDDWRASEGRPGMAAVKVHTSYEAPPRVFEQPGWPPIVRTAVAGDDADLVQAEIASASEVSDAVVVSFHWGLSMGNRDVVDYQMGLGRLAIEAGATAVFGHHPHALQPLVVHRGRPIFLSLGNIVFDYDKAWRTGPETAAAVLVLEDEELVRVELIPLRRDADGIPRRCAADQGDAALSRLLTAELGGSWSGGTYVLELTGEEVNG